MTRRLLLTLPLLAGSTYDPLEPLAKDWNAFAVKVNDKHVLDLKLLQSVAEKAVRITGKCPCK